MNQAQTSCFIPELTTDAGACLTLQNWQEVGIRRVSYSLPALLMKPGYSLLQTLSNLAQYVGWSLEIVLNASLLKANAEGLYLLRSVYDGSLIRLSQQALFSLFMQWQPHYIILPRGFAAYLNQEGLGFAETMEVYVPSEDLLENPELKAYGCYLTDENAPLAMQFCDRPLYFKKIACLDKTIPGLYESDKPASDALRGHVYTEQGSIEILASEQANEHRPIVSGCLCPTCQQGLTRAYLHHLLIHTPLLAQRFLILHNIYHTKLKI